MKKGVSIVVPAFMILLMSCMHKKAVSPGEFIRYIEDKKNGYKKEITAGDFVYSFQYKPASYIALKELQGGMPDSEAIYRREEQLSHTVWFNVSIKVKKAAEDPLRYRVAGLDEYNARLRYFMSEAGNNFRLQYGNNEEAEQSAYFFENNYGLTPMDVMIIGFRIPDRYPVQDLILIYEDELFHNSSIRVKLTGGELESVPKISFHPNDIL